MQPLINELMTFPSPSCAPGKPRVWAGDTKRPPLGTTGHHRPPPVMLPTVGAALAQVVQTAEPRRRQAAQTSGAAAKAQQVRNAHDRVSAMIASPHSLSGVPEGLDDGPVMLALPLLGAPKCCRA